MKPVIGIIGGIGSGKSAVAAVMQSLGGFLIAADPLGHEALRQPDLRAQIVHRWGKILLDAQGEINRRELGRIVFADSAERQALERLVFPYIEKRIAEEVEHADHLPGVRFIILDAAILLESGWHRFCYKIVFIAAPRAVRLARLFQQRGWSEEELTRRENAQMPLAEKAARADAIINNEEGLEKVACRVQELLEQWSLIC